MPTVRELTPADAPALTALYADYDRWADREVGAVREALAETDIAVGIEASGALIAAARVLTDYVLYATVYDVIVAVNRRGEGFGTRLMRAVRDHPDLAGTPGVSLLCRRELVPFYESVGFERSWPDAELPSGEGEGLVRMVDERD